MIGGRLGLDFSGDPIGTGAVVEPLEVGIGMGAGAWLSFAGLTGGDWLVPRLGMLSDDLKEDGGTAEDPREC